MKPAHTSPERLDGLSLDRRHILSMAANQIQRMRICEIESAFALATARQPSPLQRPAEPKPDERAKAGGADRDRTGDLMLAKHALSQLSYSPTSKDGGPG